MTLYTYRFGRRERESPPSKAEVDHSVPGTVWFSKREAPAFYKNHSGEAGEGE